MIHNIVIVENKEYQAVNDLDDKGCEGCALSALRCVYAACEYNKRGDGVDAVYKYHYKPTTSELTNYAAAIRFDAVGGV